jgi:hypothetical protein
VHLLPAPAILHHRPLAPDDPPRETGTIYKSRGKSMIPKSGYRFSEKIMLQ